MQNENRYSTRFIKSAINNFYYEQNVPLALPLCTLQSLEISNLNMIKELERQHTNAMLWKHYAANGKENV